MRPNSKNTLGFYVEVLHSTLWRNRELVEAAQQIAFGIDNGEFASGVGSRAKCIVIGVGRARVVVVDIAGSCG